MCNIAGPSSGESASRSARFLFSITRRVHSSIEKIIDAAMGIDGQRPTSYRGNHVLSSSQADDIEKKLPILPSVESH